MNTFPEILKRKRKEIGLTLAQVADAVGVSEATVQRWESGRIKNLRHEKIARLSEALDISPAELMGWAKEQPSSQAGEELSSNLMELLALAEAMDEDNLKELVSFAKFKAGERMSEG